jgi:hypothetical protein
MFTRRMIHITVLLLLLALTGCASWRASDSGSPEERRKSAASKDDLWNQTIALEKEKAAYQKQLADQQAEIDRMNKELSDQQLEIDQTSKQATELSNNLDDLTTKVKQLQDARKRETPLKEADLAQSEKMTGKQGKKGAGAKKEVPKKSPPPKARDPKSKDDLDPQMKPLQEAEQKISPPQETEPAPMKKGEGKESPEVKPSKPRSVEDLSAQMKQFEEARQKGIVLKETEPGQTKKEQLKQGQKTAVAKKDTKKEPAETKTQEPKTAKIKVLAGDGNIASARGLSKQLGKMGYRVKLTDLAPRSDFEVTMIYYGSDHRTAAETMAKRLGGGAIAKPLTWSSSFDIIVVTGRKP